MSEKIHISIVGHTNTGKTSLLRSLLRRHDFGEVQNRAGTTRHVESARLKISSKYDCVFYDTPGMEDAMSILDELDTQQSSLRDRSAQMIEQFVVDAHQYPDFEQEIKVLKQATSSDLNIYVIDAREAVLGKYKDELQLLGMCGKPILPLLNFSNEQANTETWKSALSELGLHVYAVFDTVMYNQDHEANLWQKIELLLKDKQAIIRQFIKVREQEWLKQTEFAKRSCAQFLIDIAAWQERYDEDEGLSSQSIETFQALCREHEAKHTKSLLELYQFPQDILQYTPLAIEADSWEDDVFDANTWQMYGIDVSSAVAKGGALGFSIDVLTAGMTMGLGTAVGASLGLILNKGSAIKDKLQGYKVWRLDNASMGILFARQQVLLRELVSRRHANINVSDLSQYDFKQQELPKPIKRARFKPYWSQLNDLYRSHSRSRKGAIEKLIEEL